MWIAHRKLRKKIASARWYAKKKYDEHVQWTEHCHRVAHRLHVRLSQPIWLDPIRRAEWRCVTSHMFHGWPIRPVHCIGALTWCLCMDLCTAAMDHMTDDVAVQWQREHLDHPPFRWTPAKRKAAQHLCMRELMDILQHHCEQWSDPAHPAAPEEWAAHLHRVLLQSQSTESDHHWGAWARRGVIAHGWREWVPTICTGIGSVFLGLAALPRPGSSSASAVSSSAAWYKRLRAPWSALCQRMYAYQQRTSQPPSQPLHTQLASQAQGHQYVDMTSHIHTTPPIHPMMNDCLRDAMVQRVQQTIWDIEEAEEVLGVAVSQPIPFDAPPPSSRFPHGASSSDDSSSLSIALDHFFAQYGVHGSTGGTAHSPISLVDSGGDERENQYHAPSSTASSDTDSSWPSLGDIG